MNMPTFTAGASLYSTKTHYRLPPSVIAIGQPQSSSSQKVYPAALPEYLGCLYVCWKLRDTWPACPECHQWLFYPPYPF
jgi:hypothetical protein